MSLNSSSMTRRAALATLGLAPLAGVVARHDLAAQAPPPVGPYTLPALPYAVAALQPHIDADTMTIHHGRHHQGYVTNLNAALARLSQTSARPIEDLLKNLEAIPETERQTVRNNGGGHANHTQFWTVMAPGAGGAPTGAIADALRGAFGSVETFKERFAAAALSRFGSGWAWLSDDRGTLVVHSTPNQDSPLMEGKRPIVGLDVWEHAYYLKYQNRRADYVQAFWQVIDWAEVNRRLKG